MESSKECNAAAAQPQCQPQAEAAKAAAEDAIKTASESNPYVQYNNIEDYKMKGYGAHGHLPVVDRPRHPGATDAPTPSGSAVSALRDR